MDGARDEDCPWISATAQAGGQLNRSAEQVIALRYRLTGGDPDADPHWHGEAVVGFRQALLDLDGGLDAVDHRMERGHQPVPGVLHLRPAMTLERVSDDLVMGPQHGHGPRVAELLRQAGRAFDVGEEDRAERRLHVWLARRMLDDAAHEALHGAPIDLDDLIRHEPV